MVQNLKVDIIYHSTPSDFEMEFNLCGCCRMRLLNDKTSDKKSFVKSLSRAVSRSRIIIACGPLFGENGLINTVATAIGSGTSLCDNYTYGIKSEEAIKIIRGSTPLVTADGYFGGCIIESGPQTIILLTENRNFRKSIMQNLIHPYVEEISYIPVNHPVNSYANKADEVAPQTVDTTDKKFETEKQTIETSVDSADNNIEFIMDDSSYFESPSPEFLPIEGDFLDNMYTEIESAKELKKHYENTFIPSKEDNMFLTTNDEKPQKKTSGNNKLKAMNVSIVILVLLLLLAVLALVYLVVLRPYTMGISTSDYIKEIFNITSNNTFV